MKTLATTLILIFFSLNAYAIRAQTVKGNKALLDLEGDNAEVGDYLMASSPEGKKMAILQIKQVKNGKAIAVISKGSMRPEFSLARYEKGRAAVSTTGSGRTSSSRDRKSWGLMAGYAINNMTVKPTGGSVSLTGNSFDVLAFYQMDLDKNISVKASALYETLKASGSSPGVICTGSSNCTVDFSYLGVSALIRYSFNRGSTWEFWGGAGLGFLYAMGKSSTILDTSKVTTNNTINAALGIDYQLDRKHFIPIQFEYAMFPANDTSSANQMILRAGYGWSF